MKKFAAFFLSALMLTSIPVFAAESSSTESNVSASQAVTYTKRKTKYVGRKSKKVGRRTWNGTKWVYSTSARKSRPVRHKTWHTGRKVVSRTKKVFN
jgi:hypothetical protein